jgi:hypothetical protein
VTETPTPAQRPRTRAAIAITAAAGLLVLIGAFWLARRDSGDDVARFFTLAIPSVCSTGELAIDAANPRFAAFLPDRQPERRGDKFLSVDVSIRNVGAAPQAVDIAHFQVSDRPGRTFPATTAGGQQTRLSGPLAAGETVSERIAFGLPVGVGAAKLTYDDGCTRQEWLVP